MINRQTLILRDLFLKTNRNWTLQLALRESDGTNHKQFLKTYKYIIKYLK